MTEHADDVEMEGSSDDSQLTDQDMDQIDSKEAPGGGNIPVKLQPKGVLKLTNPILGSEGLDAVVYEVTWNGDADATLSPMLGNKSSMSVADDPMTEASSSLKPGPYGTYGGRYPPPPPPPPKSPGSQIKFKDCGGLEKQISYLRTAVTQPIQNQYSSQSALRRFGLQPPKGILFYGPPGTGKTRLAQALGNELTSTLGKTVHFIYRKGQDIASKYFGQSSANLRQVFAEAKAMQPCVLFFDELDGLCPSRDSPHMHQATITIVTTMLGLMDELPLGKVFVIGATNRVEAVDSALRRPGRFDKHLEFLPPTQQGRHDILEIHTKKWKIQPSKQLLQTMSEKTVGFSGADLSKLCRDAFDQALSNFLASEGGNYSGIDFGDLSVSERNWNAALGNLKPSNTAIFGSTLYTPKRSFGDDLTPLIGEDVKEVQGMLLRLSQKASAAGTSSQHPNPSFHSLHVWMGSKSIIATVDDCIVSEVLISKELTGRPVYCLSPEVLLSTRLIEWPAKVNSAFSQAIGTSSAILYIQDVGELWTLIQNSRLGTALNLKQQLERLRGTTVTLLTTGTGPGSALTPDNPFKQVLSGAEGREYQVENPSEERREAFFERALTTLVLEGNRKWSNEEAHAIAMIHDTAVVCTRDKDIGASVRLYSLLVQESALNIAETDDNGTVLKKLLNVVTGFRTP